jgi:hypothetical protein
MKYAAADVSMIALILFKLKNICYNYVDVRWQTFKEEQCIVRQINFKSQEHTTHLMNILQRHTPDTHI